MSILHPMFRRARVAVDLARNALGWRQSEQVLARDAQQFWENPPREIHDFYSHWRSAFDDDTFHAIGREQLAIYQTFARAVGFDQPIDSIVEWGCGGGANAVQFAPLAREFHGVDIVQGNLDECARQMKSAGLDNFHPVLIDASAPEEALGKIPRPCDLFLCFYVFEVIPSPEYGARILKIASRMLRPGGLAVIQIKYPVGLTTRSRRWGYRFGVTSMTTYQVDEFWELSKACGLDPVVLTLVPRQPLVQDERYAYFALQKP